MSLRHPVVMLHSTLSIGWQRLSGCLKLHVILRRRATNYRALLRKMTCEDKASYESTQPCSELTLEECLQVAPAVAVFCSMLQCVAACLGVLLQCQWRPNAHAWGYSVLQRVSVCCSVLQCVAVCCSVLQCQWRLIRRAWGCSVLQCVAVCCSVLQCVAVCCSAFCSALQCAVGQTAPYQARLVLQCVAVCSVCCSVLQCVALCCSLLQCVAVSMAPYQTPGVARVVVCHSLFAACCSANVILPGVLEASCPICQSPCQKSSHFCRCWRPGSWASQPSASAHGT